MLVKDIVSAVIVELSQVPGIATQVYSADRIKQHVQDAYQLEIYDMWWPRYMVWQTVPVDTDTGLLANDLQGPINFIDEYENIRAVFPEGSNRPIAEFPASMNPPRDLSGTRLFIAPDYTVAHRPFRLVPPSGGNVVVHARQLEKLPVMNTTDLHIDNLLLQYDAAWMYCVDDGTVPAQVNKFQMLAAKRRKQIKALFTQHPLMLDPRYPDVPIDDPWFVLDTDALA